MARQAEQQQQQGALSGRYSHPCPACKNTMKFVGRETDRASGELLTFQCDCGQVIAARMQ